MLVTKNNAKKVSIFISLVLSVSIAFAAHPDPEKIALAKQFLKVRRIDASLKRFSKRIIHLSLEKNKKLNEISKDFFLGKDFYEKIFYKYYSPQRLNPIIIQAYMDNLTKKELRQLIKLYQQPVMQNFRVKSLPRISSDISALYQKQVKSIDRNMKNDIEKGMLNKLKIAANKGNAKAQYLLGKGYVNLKHYKNSKRSIQWMTRAANNNSIMAMNDLGVMYAIGEGVKKDERQAVSWYQKSANFGDSFGMFNLGLHYFYGSGIKKDYKQALNWFEKAAYRNQVYAQFMLAKMYLSGEGVVRNSQQGLNWLTLATYHFYDGFSPLNLEKRNLYMNTFIKYQQAKFLGIKPKYGEEVTERIIYISKRVSAKFERVCEIGKS